MKFIVDTEQKTIELKGEYTLAEINKQLAGMFSDWEQYTILTPIKLEVIKIKSNDDFKPLTRPSTWIEDMYPKQLPKPRLNDIYFQKDQKFLKEMSYN